LPGAQEAYYPDPERRDRHADPERQHPCDEAGRLADWFRPCCDSRRFIHVDLGATRDACGVVSRPAPTNSAVGVEWAPAEARAH
jgi:hypothetical protein